MKRRLPAPGSDRRALLDRMVFEKLWREYTEARNYRGRAFLKAIYREAYPAWPEFAEKAPSPAP